MEKYHRFSNPKEVDVWVQRHYTQKELNELGENKIFALLFYKGDGYRYMNNCVRAGTIDETDVVDINSLQQLLLSKQIQESIEVYRFVDFKELNILLHNTSKKQVYEYPSFLSTTLLLKHYSMEKIKKGKFSIAIRIPQGTHGTYLPEINDNSPEYEVLLPHHLKLRS